MNTIESNAESNEIEKFKLHINEIDTITTILLKLSSRLAKVENDLLMLSGSNDHAKVNFIKRLCFIIFLNINFLVSRQVYLNGVKKLNKSTMKQNH